MDYHSSRIQTLYTAISSSYDHVTANQISNDYIDKPTLLHLLSRLPTAGASAIDIGCGTGRYTAELVRLGATVTGIDPNESLIAIARSRLPGIRFIRGDFAQLPVQDQEVDLAVSGLTISHVVDLSQAFREVWRVLKPGGYFAFSRNNPYFEVVNRDEGKELFNQYFAERWEKSKWKTFGIEMPFFHHKLETILNALVDCGLEIVEYRDSEPSAEAKLLYPEAFAKEASRPHFIAILARRK